MNEIYWITRLDAIKSVIALTIDVNMFAFIVLLVVFVIRFELYKDTDDRHINLKKRRLKLFQNSKKWLTISIISLSVLLLALIFTPSTYEALRIISTI